MHNLYSKYYVSGFWMKFFKDSAAKLEYKRRERIKGIELMTEV